MGFRDQGLGAWGLGVRGLRVWGLGFGGLGGVGVWGFDSHTCSQQAWIRAKSRALVLFDTFFRLQRSGVEGAKDIKFSCRNKGLKYII